MIKNSISKAQIEVWEWKEALYEELKKIPENKRLEFIHNKTASTIERIKKASVKVKQDNGLK